MLDISAEGKLCFVGSRVSFMNFDIPIQDKKEEFYPICVEYNSYKNELVYSTRKELRFIDLTNGRHKSMFQGILTNHDDELTIFKCIN